MKFGGRISLTLSVTRPPLLRRRVRLEPARRCPALGHRPPCNFSNYDRLRFRCCAKPSGLKAPAGRTRPIATTNAINATTRNLIGHPPASCSGPPSTAAAIRWCPIVAAQAAEPGREISMKFCGSFSDLCRPTAHIDRLGARTGPATAWRCGSRLTTLHELQTHVRSRATYSERNRCWRGTPVGVSSAHI